MLLSVRLKAPTGNREAAMQQAPHLTRLLDDPCSVTFERCDAGEAAAAVLTVGAGRPAHHADQGEARGRRLVGRRAGIAGAGAEARALIVGRWIDQAELQIAGLAGG